MKISGCNLKMLIREALLENEIYDYDNKLNVATKKMSDVEDPFRPQVASAEDIFKKNYEPPPAKPFDLDKVANETARRFNEDYEEERLQINAPKARAGKRRLVTAYGQNRDVFIYGPFKNYVVKTINGESNPDEHFKSNYGTAKKVFNIYKEYAQPYIDSKKGMTITSKQAQKDLWGYFKFSKDDTKTTEKYWKDSAAAAEAAGRGTHMKGKAFDMTGYNDKSNRKHLDLLYKVAKEVAKNYSSEFLMPGKGSIEEVDHIHMAYKVN